MTHFHSIIYMVELQDNNTQGGPSRTDNLHGIRNSDWFVVLGGDGHQPATRARQPKHSLCSMAKRKFKQT